MGAFDDLPTVNAPKASAPQAPSKRAAGAGVFDDLPDAKPAASGANDSGLARMVSGQRPVADGDYPSVLSSDYEKRAGGDLLGRLQYSASQVMPSLFKGDAGIRDRAMEAVPGSRLEQTEAGAELVVTPEGQRYYVNRPGFDMDDGFRFGGQLASFLPAGRLVRAATIPGRAVQAAIGAGATDVSGQGLSGQGVDPLQTAFSTVAGGFGQAGADALIKSGRAAAAKVAPELRALYERAKAAGIHLTPAQLSDSEFVKRVTTQLGKLPFGGGRQIAERQQAAGNRELAKLIGQDADAVTPRVMADAADEIGRKFDGVFANGMRYDRQFLQEVSALWQEAAGLDAPAQNALEVLIGRLEKQAADGSLTGRTLQSLDQQARKWASGGGDRQHIVQAFRETLHEAFGRQAPPMVKATWDTARRQWAALKTLEPVVARNTEGGVPLAQVQGAVNATKAGRTARARGRDGDMGVLASIGQRTKAPTSSGSNENFWATQALNPLAWPLLGAASVGGLLTRATINNPRLAPMLMNESRGGLRQLVAPYVKPVAPALTPYFPRQAAASESKDRKK